MGRLQALEAGLGFSACSKKLNFASLSNIGGERQAYIGRFMGLPAWRSLPITLWGPPPSCSAEGRLFCLAFLVIHRPSGLQWTEQGSALMGGHHLGRLPCGAQSQKQPAGLGGSRKQELVGRWGVTEGQRGLVMGGHWVPIIITASAGASGTGDGWRLDADCPWA